MTIAVVDDMASDREWLAVRIRKYMKSQELKYNLIFFETGESFVEALETERFDVVFMDIYMDGMNGMEAASILRQKDMDCKLVFLTVSEEAALQCCAFHVCHYLVKPATEEDFLQAMKNCRIKPPVEVPVLQVYFDRSLRHIETAQIIYIDFYKHNTLIHLATHTVSVFESFKKVTAPLLADKRFLSCIQGVVVNMDYISEPEESVFRLKNGECVQIALRNYKNVIRQYHAYLYGRMGEGS